MNRPSLRLSTHDELYVIDLDEVLYFQADDHYSNVYYASGANFMVPFGLSKVEAAIGEVPEASMHMLRLGRKYIVNTNRIFRISTIKSMLYLADNHGSHTVLQVPKPVLRGLIELVGSAR